MQLMIEISYEASSANAYNAIGLAMECERTGYDGSATFFFAQAAEETEHMLKFLHYLNSVGGRSNNPSN